MSIYNHTTNKYTFRILPFPATISLLVFFSDNLANRFVFSAKVPPNVVTVFEIFWLSWVKMQSGRREKRMPNGWEKKKNTMKPRGTTRDRKLSKLPGEKNNQHPIFMLLGEQCVWSGHVHNMPLQCMGVLSVNLTTILYYHRQLLFNIERDNIHCSIYLCFTDRDTC